VISLASLDGRSDLRFEATHPRIAGHLAKGFVAVPSDLPPPYAALRRP
jgi:hypothetical protein